MDVLLLVACFSTVCAASRSDVVFPDSHDAARPSSGHNQIPLDLMLQLSSVENFADFLRFVSNTSLEPGILNLSGRLGEDGAVVPKNAVCSPEMQVVDLIQEKNTSMLYFPVCTRLPRCGGCCASELLKCQPTKTETVEYMVYVTQFEGGNTVSVRQKQIVSVEKHIECGCGCAVKSEDCHQLQTYDADGCRCRCLNAADEQRCRAENDTKIWDSNKCMCNCRQIQNCSTSYIYDYNTCSCTKQDDRRRRGVNTPSRRRSRLRTPTPVRPLVAEARRRRHPSSP